MDVVFSRGEQLTGDGGWDHLFVNVLFPARFSTGTGNTNW